jgi:UDP-N-acetyl-2-amino-2-deoxyglucuronate dehydrogenase
MNIGIHFFDLLLWLFGPVQDSKVTLHNPRKMAGTLELEWAKADWFLSVDEDDLPESAKKAGKHAYRSLTMDGEEIEFSEGFTNLHTRVYEEIMAGRGTRITDSKPSINLVYQIRSQKRSY